MHVCPLSNISLTGVTFFLLLSNNGSQKHCNDFHLCDFEMNWTKTCPGLNSLQSCWEYEFVITQHFLTVLRELRVITRKRGMFSISCMVIPRVENNHLRQFPVALSLGEFRHFERKNVDVHGAPMRKLTRNDYFLLKKVTMSALCPRHFGTVQHG